ncbi:hypothetical protein HD597_000641 [Nonomuraea thailandensis]|uniref:Uncharacterized protein n=1 Tax=Nonomuraea thailandensis TaxID=1188745 RepID=A0A9X2K1K1_9ACTN|nr:hypothetical protein [Nonomuraea thailandensis]MCP2353621.1 hypothetical protein [Nonomuraea thailandensis]
MHLVIVTLRHDAVAVSEIPSAAVVTDVFWALAAHSDGLRHVHAIAHLGDLRVALFLQSDGAERALLAARRLCDRALARAPILTAWKILENT